MNWNTLEVYIRENQFMLMGITTGIIGVCLLWILIQVSLTRHEVHKICKKIRKYFEIVLKEDEEILHTEENTEKEEYAAPIYEAVSDYEQEQKKKQRDAELLMEVISEVF